VSQFLSDPKAIWYLMRATGIVVVALLSLSVTLGVLSTARVGTRWWPQFATQALHRTVSLLAVTLLFGHVVAAVVHTFVDISWIDVVVPFVSNYRPFWVGLGALAVDLLVVIVVTSLLRHRLNHGAWRAVHLSTYGAWFLGMIHGIGIGTDTTEPWAAAVTIGSAALVGVAVVMRLATWRADKAHGHGPAPMPSRVVHVDRRGAQPAGAGRQYLGRRAERRAAEALRGRRGDRTTEREDDSDVLPFWQEIGS